MEKSGFFNSINGDRMYNADFFAEYFSSFIGNGIFPKPSSYLQIIANNNMSITIKPGKAWINGYYYNNMDNLILDVDVADGVLNRIDRVVLQFNTVKREIKALIKKGDFASNAEAKKLQRNADAYELALADIKIDAGAISITQSSITDLRGSELCGIVHGTVDQVSTASLFKQYKTWYLEKTTEFEKQFKEWFDKNAPEMSNEFNMWFKYIKDRLEGIDVAQLAMEFDVFKKKLNKIQDIKNNKLYKWGIEDGIIFLEEVEE